MSTQLNIENSVSSRYSGAAQQREAALCCPVQYRTDLLEVVPKEILERDYGCGDPSPFVEQGDTVLDLGSGGGKLCYITSQLVGESGQVIGVDCNQEMLQLARGYQAQVAEKIGYDNVSFRCGMIQNLQLDLELLAERLDQSNTSGLQQVLEYRRIEQQLSKEAPLVESDSVDCVISNCVLNLVQPSDRKQLFQEVFRVLKKGGRAAISDIVADEDVPEHMKNNSELWSGCISGAWREDQFLEEFERAGFHGVTLAKRESDPWQTVEGIEFRSVTVLAYKGKQGPCYERNQAVIYPGPFKKVYDDNGNVYERGARMAVCDKTYNLLQKPPYKDSFIALHPRKEIPLEQAELFDCEPGKIRSPRDSKGEKFNLNTQILGGNCSGDSCC